MKKKVIVIGGGFAGIQFIRKLDATKFEVLLIDKINHYQFQPLFYQVATSQLEPSSISFPLRNIFNRAKNVQIRLAEVQSINTVSKQVITTIGTFDYDEVVIAIGCKTNFFGNQELAKHCLTLKTTYEAIQIRNHILQLFERILSASEEEKQALLNLVIVGAGPTGVELAGAFAEIKQHILPKDYPGIDFSKFNIYLVEGSKNTLGNMSAASQKESRHYLQSMGVQLKLETIVKSYDGQLLTFTSGEQLTTRSVIWAAGVTGNSIKGLERVVITPNNRIKVNRQNAVLNHEHIYAIGDIAYMETTKYPKGHPQVANVAINQAKVLAKNLNQDNSKTLIDFEFNDPGSMATIGRNKTVVDLPHLHLKGYPAWVIWMFLHLMFILSVRNKLIIFINWAWAYVTKDSSLRLILLPKKDPS